MITVYDFLELYTTGDRIEIFDLETLETVYKGFPDEAQLGEFSDFTVQSFDVEQNGLVVINIDLME